MRSGVWHVVQTMLCQRHMFPMRYHFIFLYAHTCVIASLYPRLLVLVSVL